MEKRRVEYLDAHRKMEAMTKLEEKGRAAHRRAANREEQAEFDDRRYVVSRSALTGT